MKTFADLPSDNPSESASAVADALTNNKASAAAVHDGADGETTVKRASVKRSMHRGKGGKFVRKNAADTVEKPQNTDSTEPKPQEATVADGDDGGFVRVPTEPEPQAEPTGVSMGPEAGRVITDGLFGLFEKRGGDRWKPTDAEREMVGKAASGATDGRHVPWWLALALAVGFYAMARIGMKQVKEGGTDGVNEHGNHRTDAKRENTARQAAGWNFEGRA